MSLDWIQTTVKTKIVATVGPTSETPEMLGKLAHAGADVFRLNFAHGDWKWHSAMVQKIRSVSSAVRRPLAILQDLGGPKLRLGEIPGGALNCNFGDKVRIVRQPTGNPADFTCTYEKLIDDLIPGDDVLLADGTVGLKVESKTGDVAQLVVTLPGEVRSKQGIAAPHAKLQLEPLTEKDINDLDWTAANEIDYVGLSFVRRPEDIDNLREELKKRKSEAHIIAKIEKAEALNCLDEIILRTDAVMVARGDLGIEIDVARVPMVQKRIIERCRVLGKPVITATQMLESMRTSNRPTRAEATDVANAILDGTDAIMLSAETASGQYPYEAVATMNRIALETEKFLPRPIGVPSTEPIRNGQGSLPATVLATVEAAGLLAERVRARLVVVTTRTGRAAVALSKQRHTTPTLGLSDQPQAVRKMALCWGVLPVFFPEPIGTGDSVHKVTEWAKKESLIAPGDKVVYLLGASWADGGHNTVLVHEVK